MFHCASRLCSAIILVGMLKNSERVTRARGRIDHAQRSTCGLAHASTIRECDQAIKRQVSPQISCTSSRTVTKNQESIPRIFFLPSSHDSPMATPATPATSPVQTRHPHGKRGHFSKDEQDSTWDEARYHRITGRYGLRHSHVGGVEKQRRRVENRRSGQGDDRE